MKPKFKAQKSVSSRVEPAPMTAAALGVSPPTLNLCPPDIDYHEAINDSPRFRQNLQEHHLYFQKLENRLHEILKHLTAMQDFGRNYSSTFYRLSVSVNQLCEESFAGNALARSSLHSISDAYARTVHLTKQYYEESNALVYGKLQSLIKTELAKLSESRQHFEQMSLSADEALAKNAAGSRCKQNEAIECRNQLLSVGACFAHTTLDYAQRIHLAHAAKDHQVLDALWTFVKETSAFFSKGHAFFDEWTAIDNGGVADTVKALEHKVTYTGRQMQDVHGLVPSEMYQHPTGISPDPHVVMEGYLYKRSSNAFKTWNRRWFQIKDNKLLYTHRGGDDGPTVMENNLMLCLVRPAPPSLDRAACFELVTPSRTHLLQADSESLCNAWMRALQRTILHLHESDDQTCDRGPSTSTTSPSTSSVPACPPGTSTDKVVDNREDTSAIALVRTVPGCMSCADCGEPDPKWASINLGVTLCIECCGIHRSLGVQVSKVRSVTMDSWDGEVRGVFSRLGNDRVNGILLAHLPADNVIPPRPNQKSTRAVREAWIKAKYVERRFAIPPGLRAHLALSRKISNGVCRSASSADVARLDSTWTSTGEEGGQSEDTHSDEGAASEIHERKRSDLKGPVCASSPSEMLSAARAGDVPALLAALSHGADINAVVGGTTPLHQAVLSGESAAVEFILLNGGKLNLLDDQMSTPLHVAAREGHTLQVCQLLKRGADKCLRNGDGETPLEIAVEKEHADIVTLFRVHTMRDEFNEEFDNPMNQTVDDVILDIMRRAANGKMNREKELEKGEEPENSIDPINGAVS